MPTAHQSLNCVLPEDVERLLSNCQQVTVARNIEQLVELAIADAGPDGWHDVAYDVPGKGQVVEARACRVKNGIAANYPEAYMRRRDPDSMVIADNAPSNKARFHDRYGKSFDPLRTETLKWLENQPLAVFPFVAGLPGQGIDALAICPANAGFFALGLALLQGILDVENLPDGFKPRAVIYVAPPFRHTHFEGKQIVVHNRTNDLYELFSYNLYPGPSAKKGVYGMLINLGEQQEWVTAHCSTVQVITPYDNRITIMHEGASGGGKSEMLEPMHREPDGRLLLCRNVLTGEERRVTLPRGCDLRPVTDDMALCHPSLQKNDGKLGVTDAENAWFVRVNHITHYGTDPNLEAVTTQPGQPLLFLNIEAVPNSTALIWEHIQDSPGKFCPNPRVVIPRQIIPGVVTGSISVDIRSFGVRTPPCTAENPSYGILGLFHPMPPALAWLWRLVAPRGHDNPSVVSSKGGDGAMSSEGVGSYWPFATGRRVDQANLLLKQILNSPKVRYILCPNQHVGVWKVGFMAQWLAREYLARRGGAKFTREQVAPARCPLLGYALKSVMIEGHTISNWFLRVEQQPEVGEDGYDAGAALLREFFHQQLSKFLESDLLPQGRRIIQCCLDDGSVEDYASLVDADPAVVDG